MKIAICDDDKIGLEKIKNTVEDFIRSNENKNRIILQVFYNGLELLDYIKKNGDFDLYILDIFMPEINGINLAEEIRKKDTHCKIIFLTYSPDFAVDSYKVGASYYLLKPFSNDELIPQLNKALDCIEEENNKSIMVKENGRLTRLEYQNIIYIESIKHTLNINLDSGKILVCYGSMKQFKITLLQDERFYFCHRAFIVNIDYVASLTNRDFVLLDKTLIPISRHIYPKLKQDYINYLFRSGVNFL